MKNKYKKAIWLIFTVAWMVLIILFSAQDRQRSSAQSRNFIRVAASVFYRGFNSMTAAEQRAFINSIHRSVRKSAHVFLYFSLGILITNNLYIFAPRLRRKPLIAVAAGFAFGALDELHQYFVPGRGASFGDVMLDTAAAALGVAVVVSIRRLVKGT
jgi:VanZ family protein